MTQKPPPHLNLTGKTTEEAILKLKALGYQIIAIEQTSGSKNLLDWQPTPESKTAFVFGHEVMGVSEEALALCNGAIEIPQFGTKHSLNVSVTAGIVLWDVVMKHRAAVTK